MKKKFIIFTLCFTLIFSSFNYKKSYADGGVVSLPVLATVSALATGTGILIKNSDDLYDLGRMFFDYVDRHNSLTWETVNALFVSSVTLQSNKLVSVKSDFLDIVKDFFDYRFSSDYPVAYSGLVPVFDTSVPTSVMKKYMLTFSDSFDYDVYYPLGFQLKHSDGIYYDCYFKLIKDSWGSYFVMGYYDSNKKFIEHIFHSFSSLNSLGLVCTSLSYGNFIVFSGSSFQQYNSLGSVYSTDSYSFPYSGGYTWDNVESKKENESISLPIPGDLDVLVGQNSDDFWGNTDNLVGNGGLTLPGVDSPSISVDTSVNTFPSVDSDVPGVDSPSVPNEGIWSTIKDFIIGLVVPSDTYWTDTWGGLYNNFTSSFPMVDMDGFNDLVTGEKKFPNIDINIMGVTGRVVNGDVVNSIVDWLRPIIAGFMMLCLMLFNYRKIYKLIRNSEPFGGIAPGTSDFSTGISEYNKEPVIKAVDMASEYRAWRENGGK